MTGYLLQSGDYDLRLFIVSLDFVGVYCAYTRVEPLQTELSLPVFSLCEELAIEYRRLLHSAAFTSLLTTIR